MRDDSFRSPSVCNSAKPRLGSIKNLTSRWKVFSAVCPKDHLPASACLEKTEVNSPQIPAASPGWCSSVHFHDSWRKLPFHSSWAFWILVWVLTHHIPVLGRTKCHSKEQTEDRDAQRRGAAHPHLLSRAARPQPWHQTFWEQNPLFSFKISVFKHTAHPHSPGFPTGYSHPSTKLASFHGETFYFP